MPNPTVFISYSWDNDAHKEWVFDLATKLENAGIDVKLDSDGAQPGTQIPDWMERAIVESDYVILVCTPGYRDRWYRNIGGVGYEGTVIKGQLLAPNGITRFIPILRGGAWRAAAPPYFYGAIYLDLTNDLPSEIESLIDCLHRRKTLNLPDRDALPLGNLWMLPVLPTRFFTGQVGKVKEIREAFNQAKPLGITPVEGLTGEGGIGKTELALQYCRVHQSEYREILWLNGNSRASLQADLTRAKEGILGTNDGLDGLPGAGLQRALMMIRCLQGQTDWLVVLDNVDTPDALREEDKRASEEAKQDASLFDPILKLRNGHVLITTRQDFWGDLAQTIRLDVLSEEEGALLFLKRTLNQPDAISLNEFKPEDREAGMAFSREVGGFQLAIEQGGATARTYQWSPARYLKEFQTRFEEMIKKRGKGVDRHEDAVYATVLTSLEEIEKIEPRAREFITWCAYLPPDWIIEEIFQFEDGPLYESINGVRFEDLILIAKGQSLIHLSAESSVYTMHRLMQKVIQVQDSSKQSSDRSVFCLGQFSRMQYGENDREIEVSRSDVLAYVAIFLDSGVETDQHVVWGRLVPIWRHLAERTTLDQFSILCSLKVTYFGCEVWGGLGVLQDAEVSYQRAKKILAPENPLMLDVAGQLAVVYIVLGRYIDALSLNKTILTLRKKYWGIETIETVKAMSNLAWNYGKVGQNDEAIELSKQAVEINTNLFGQSHFATLLTMSNLAILHEEAGNHAIALSLNEEVLLLRIKSVGPFHPHTMMTKNNLAQTYSSLGRYSEALKLNEEVLDFREQFYGPEHPFTLHAMNHIACTYNLMGSYVRALAPQKDAATLMAKIIGPNHPDTLHAHNNLAWLYWNLKREKEAVDLMRKVQIALEEVYGRDHYRFKMVLHSLQDMLTARPDLALPGELESLQSEPADQPESQP